MPVRSPTRSLPTALLLLTVLTAACGSATDRSTPTDASGSAAPGAGVACDGAEEPVLVAYERATGAASWRSCSGVPAWRRVLAVSEHTVLVLETIETAGSPSTQHDELVAIDPADGRERWRQQLSPHGPWLGPEDGPVAGAGVVVVVVDAAGTPMVTGLDELSGAQRWAVPAETTRFVVRLPDGSVAGSADGAPIAGQLPASVVHTDRFAIVPALDGLRALDRTTGVERWHATGVEQAETASGDTVIAHAAGVLMGSAPELVGLDGRTGTIRWQHAASLYSWHATANAVLAQPNDSTISALDAATGTVRWTQPGTPSYGGLMAISDSTVVIFESHEQRSLVGYDLEDGVLRWRRQVGPTMAGQPQLGHGDAVFLLGGGLLTALAAEDGSTRWAVLTPAGKLESSVGADEARVYVTSNTMPWRD
ncbi:MAG: PQQ-binding-like beta-propeller repeat protein [Acidimicrobiia bacterium]